MSEEQRENGGENPGYHQEVQHSAATARVPERVGVGVFSTGTIVMHGPHEFVIDFLQSLAPPRRVASRVVLPPTVVPLFLAAMRDNFDKYTRTFGPLPRMPVFRNPPDSSAPNGPGLDESATSDPPTEFPESSDGGEDVLFQPDSDSEITGRSGNSESEYDSEQTPFPLEQPSPGLTHPGQTPPPSAPPPVPITEVYEQLKLPDDMLAGCYANTVVISHTGAEFCFDFIASFFPRSAVAARIYMSCPHVGELYESLGRSWDQFRNRHR